jgi:ATP-dependent protease ClpP protease subunit
MMQAFSNRDRAEAAIAAIQRAMAPPEVRIVGEITNQLEREVRRAIDHAARQGDTVHCTISSRGGAVAPAELIARHLRQTGMPIWAHVWRRCDSAALTPLLVASRRTAQPNATFHLHATRYAPEDLTSRSLDVSRMRKLTEQLENDDSRYRLQLAALRLPTWAELRALSPEGLTLAARDACTYGLLDWITARPDRSMCDV